MPTKAIDEALHLISRAAFGLAAWDEAMASFAAATGSRTGQLIGIGTPSGIQYNVMTETDPAALATFVEVGGADPHINSRMRVGLFAPEMVAFDDRSLTPDLDASRSPDFGAWITDNRMGYCKLINIRKDENLIIGAGVIRDPAQGEMSREQEKTFDLLALALRNAVDLQLALEGDQIQLVAQSFESLAKPIFICNVGGQIVAMSPQAEAMLAEGHWLTVRLNRLLPAYAKDAGQFESAFQRAVDPLGSGSSVVIHDAGGAPMHVLLRPLPVTERLRLTRAVIVVPSVVSDQTERLATLAQQVFALTKTESRIAALIAHGQSPNAIAKATGIAPSTVRSHLKRIFAKTGVHGQVELGSLLNSLR